MTSLPGSAAKRVDMVRLPKKSTRLVISIGRGSTATALESTVWFGPSLGSRWSRQRAEPTPEA